MNEAMLAREPGMDTMSGPWLEARSDPRDTNDPARLSIAALPTSEACLCMLEWPIESPLLLMPMERKAWLDESGVSWGPKCASGLRAPEVDDGDGRVAPPTPALPDDTTSVWACGDVAATASPVVKPWVAGLLDPVAAVARAPASALPAAAVAL